MGKISFIGGSEPYLVDYHKNKLIGQFDLKELNFMEATSFDESVYDFLFTFPMGDDRKVVYLSVDSLNEVNNPLYKKYEESPSDFGELVVKFRNHDGRESFYKKLVKDGVLQLYDKVPTESELAAFLEKKVSQRGVSFENKETLSLFIERENYWEKKDITLYNILSDLNNLVALGNTITKEMVLSVVPDNANEQTFEIAKMIAAKNISGLRKQAVLCKGNEIGTLAALLREYRIAYKLQYFTPAQIGTSKFAFKGLTKEQLLRGIDIVTDAISSSKQGSMPKETILEHTFLKLTYLYGITE